MDLQLSVVLLFVLFTGGHSLSCYECMSLTGSCAEQQVTTCTEPYSTCMSSTLAQIEGNPIKVKGCLPSNICLYPSFSSADVSLFCCNTDLCNAKDAELSGESNPNINPPNIFNVSNIPNIFNVPNIPNIFNVPNIPNIFNVSNPPIPNGKRCYHCNGQSCLNIMDCSGSQDRCIEGTATFNGQTFPINGCAHKAACESVASVSCCEGNLCNGAQSVTQSVLFLCCSLLSYFLMH